MKLQNNFTTPEQSKRLLELGLPKNSADCFYDGWEELVCRDERYKERYFFDTHPECVPCWSVGRLIEIELLCREQREGMFARLSFYQTDKQPIDGIGTGDIVEGLVRYLESKDYKYDFSKLED